MTPLLEGTGLELGYGDHTVLRGVDFSLDAGEVVALVGPNGAGKSTLLHALLGLIPKNRGRVRVGGLAIETLQRRDIARRIAFVPQESRTDFAFTVRELVAMGRTPYLGRFRPERELDTAAVDHALEVTETRGFEGRIVAELSGGERQRVHLARAIAQTTDILLLDEPTANLDLEHQLEVLDLVRKLARTGKAAAVALHDLSLAARYADRLVVLADGRVVASGKPESVLTETLLSQWFHIRGRVHKDPEDGIVVIVPQGVMGRIEPPG
jgi:iron complex transport system ATP-binding protein